MVRNSQYTHANIKKVLVENKAINTNRDNEIQVSEASSFSGQIYCRDKEIKSLKGIDAFTALTNLYCPGNQLTSLDVSKNTFLKALACDRNQLTSLDVSKNTALTFILNCSYNQLTSLDVSKNIALTYLNCTNNYFDCDALNKKYGLE